MVHKEWDDVTVSFLDNIVVPADLDDPDGHRRLRRLKDTLSHESISAQLRLECAAVATLAYSLIESTYLLEGDGPTSLIAYDLVVANRQHLVAFASGDMEAWPVRLRTELQVVRDDITCGGRTQDEATALLKKVVAKAAKPALAYFHRTIFGPDAPTPSKLRCTATCSCTARLAASAPSLRACSSRRGRLSTRVLWRPDRTCTSPTASGRA